LINHSKPKIIVTSDDKLNELVTLRHDEVLKTIISPEGDMSFHQLLERGSGRFRALDRERADTAVILYTGGTTGIPKGVMLSHENINAAIHTVVFNERSSEKDRSLCFLPFNHVFGQMHVMNATILSGGCLELLPAFDLTRVLSLMEAGRVSKLYAVPTFYFRMLGLEELEKKLGSVRYCFSAAASIAGDVVHQWKERTGLAIYEGYGMTEAAPTVTFNHRYRHVVGSVGTEVPGVEIQIRDYRGDRIKPGQEGEICIRGPNIMKGYLDNPKETGEAFWKGGWFRSGDIGRFDDNGYLYIIDRIKDMVITGGENVYSREVEDVLYTRREIQECAVIGVPDPEWGERVTALLLLRPGEDVDNGELKAYMKSRLSPFKVPKEYLRVKDFPRSPSGKILKRELRKQFARRPGP
jgi:long-chain acyl-CoA synthetase